MPASPRIVCKAGPSLSQLSPVDVNRSPLSISHPLWEGHVAVRLRDYRGPVAQEGEYERQPREELMNEGDTWSISFEGRWKDEGITADDVVRCHVFLYLSLDCPCGAEPERRARPAAVWQRVAEADPRLPPRASPRASSVCVCDGSDTLLRAAQYGTSAALRFVRYMDPSLECDLYADKPWALVRVPLLVSSVQS